ncbi:transcription factor [Brevibacterium sediminis]|uniref:Transcription factor n=1 Tax=Brevibacterium sediminis TaxID=1857024 RepID=A0ABQ1MWG7_9MICO|nr:FCD domain-containing protein [Brevibacterium sediminis]GGC48338.1 transcription factor [Brevibacterium sediminis]
MGEENQIPAEAADSPKSSLENRGNLHETLRDQVGQDIVSGRLAAGTIIKAEDLRARYDVSLSVVREVVRVLESLGMLQPIRRVGLVVLAMSEWMLLDPLVIRWRMTEAPARQLRSLTELRVAIEPEAAGLAAQYAPAEAAEEIMGLAARMRASGRQGDVEAFLEADVEFHRAVLGAGGNELFAAFDTVIGEILAGRTGAGLMPKFPHPDALQWHFDVADAIGGQDPARAKDAMAKIVAKADAEMGSVWADEPRHPSN